MPIGRSQAIAGLVGVALGMGLTLGVAAALAPDPPAAATAARPTCGIDSSSWSVARRWDEATLEAIRGDFPAPTVHARNLFHVSVAMWDAWAAYDDSATGYLVEESAATGLSPTEVAEARNEAISYAAYRVLESRYLTSAGASDAIPSFDALMDELCYPVDVVDTQGDSPAALGNRIGAAVLAAGAEDGSNEPAGYADPDYHPVNRPLAVAEPGTRMRDPNRWQPLRIEQMVSQNGIPVVDDVQTSIGHHWGSVRGFALPSSSADRDGSPPVDPGPPPRLGASPAETAAFQASALEVLALSNTLDPTAGNEVDISPAAQGDNPLGTYDGDGYAVNPVSGARYEPNLVNEADFGRAVAEFWADGPRSETPPGHWNTIANDVSDRLDPDLRLAGTGPVLDRLEWDVKLYLALNGATHDAAIAAWGSKGFYDYSRPISMIRHLGGNGQSSDPRRTGFARDGLPLRRGLVELVTRRSTAPGERHEALAKHIGEVAVRSWAGQPRDPESEVGGVDWIRALEWLPYQMPTFVTPSFAGYVSGHSTFSRAAAEVMAAMTGSEFFPDGLGQWRIPADSLEFEAGPDRDVVLQWATYADAADQAGLSRLYGGIHVRADDLAGRVMGAECGRNAWAKALAYYGGVS